MSASEAVFKLLWTAIVLGLSLRALWVLWAR